MAKSSLLWHSVILPYYHKSHVEQISWCDQHCSSEQYRWSIDWDVDADEYTDTAIVVEFYFRNREIAVQFELTHG